MKQILTGSFFANNRNKLLKLIGDGPPTVLAANGLMQRSNDTEYYFEQDRNFFYLSGLDQPDWVLVMDESEEYLIEPELSEVGKIFNGASDLDEIRKKTGIEKIYGNQEGWNRLRKLSQVRTTVASEERISSIYTNPAKKLFLDKLGAENIDITSELLQLRSIKSEPEVTAIRRAIELTGEGFELSKEQIDEASNEADIEAIFTSHFIKNGVRHGYEPIVAGEKNACTLHYTANNHKLPTGGLVLVDIGAQNEYYNADITRTIELGKPSDRQREVKKAVKTAFDTIMEAIKPGLGLDEYQKESNSAMLEAINSLRLGKSLKDLEKYYPHAPSHGLGLDVHDPIVGYDSFQPGMVVTLEPGIYITEESIGVRHEDDLLITENGVENLSQSIKE